MDHTSLKILYEDPQIIVCVKPAGIPTQTKKIGLPDMVSLLKNHLAGQSPSGQPPYLALIHRLDQPVAGILVFARTPAAAKALNQQLTSHQFGKYYRALVFGRPPREEDTLEDYLVKDSRSNTSRICTKDTPGAKSARLHYTIVKKGQGFFNLGRGIFENTTSPTELPTELDIHLDTGRHHQIRVQLAAMGCPIIGDFKYGPGSPDPAVRPPLMLCAYRLEFLHPVTRKKLCFQLAKEEEGA